MAEYFLHPVSDTEAALVPFPPLAACPLDKRAAFAAAPPADVLAAAARVPRAQYGALPSAPTAPLPDPIANPEE